MSWEQFLADSTKEYEGKPVYVVDGDIGVTYDQLRPYYDQLVKNLEAYNASLRAGNEDIATLELPSTVHLSGGSDDIWGSSQRNNLTYCVTKDFGSNYNYMVNQMAGATSDLEGHGNFNFVHKSQHDGNCSNSNSSVLFSVRPWNSGGACAFFPLGGGCVTRTVVINMSQFNGNPVTKRGVLRHELGHVLGLRHEHVRYSGTSCSESGWRAVTSYDSSSMMHYPQCPGSTNSGDLNITSLDSQGMGILYSGSGPGPGPGTDPNSCRDNNACGNQAPGGCYCDSACTQYNDCCSDGPC